MKYRSTKKGEAKEKTQTPSVNYTLLFSVPGEWWLWWRWYLLFMYFFYEPTNWRGSQCDCVHTVHSKHSIENAMTQ